MTKDDIKSSIQKHSVKPVIAVAVLLIFIKVLNIYVFANDPLSPVLLIIGTLWASIHIFKNVLFDLFVTKENTVNGR